MTIFRPSREKIILYLAVLFLIFAVVAIYSNTLTIWPTSAFTRPPP
ncbi:MAG: hypothetical protein Q7S40_31100 [Opitutaceae bacterium]|nr:hypothetical protein [Opitutaceae bacterium]